MDNSYENENGGNIKISDDVIATLAAKAAKEVDGIVGMTGGFVGNITAAVLGKKDTSKGIDVEMKDGIYTVTLHVKVKYGVKIPEVAWKAQENVKTVIESMTGIMLDKVNISVEGIDFTEEVPEQTEESTAEITSIDVVEEK